MATTTKTDAQLRLIISKLSALAIANALIFQQELAGVDARVRPLRHILSEANLIRAFAEQWKFITDDINYIPIFDVGLAPGSLCRSRRRCVTARGAVP
jgi:hypothetical protein